MFNVQGSEIIIIAILALVVLGPEKLPDAIRKAAHFYGEFRKVSTGFQTELRNALDEPMRELQQTADLVRKNADLRSLTETDRTDTKPASRMAAVTPAEPADTPAEPPASTAPSSWAAPAAGAAADPSIAPPAPPDPERAPDA